MAKYYKHLETGAIITEEEFNNLAQAELNRENMELGGMNPLGMTDILEGELMDQPDDYSKYVPCDEEGNLLEKE